VLLAASALRARIITAQQLSAWRLRRERMAIDSRFWASMTMSAIAAVIALVIVSVVPHYAAKSLPSRILNTNPSVDANVVAPVATVSAPVQKTVTPVRKSATATGSQNRAAKPTSVNAESAKPATNPKPKHVLQDDYVAPNTYKYYGTGSKASR
jgi:ABC-type lipoprotein release transport system permease subunit